MSVPFLRPVGEGLSVPLLPDGWETHPAGSIAGDLMEMAFDPRRHDVTLVWDKGENKSIARAIVTEGWQPLARTDDACIWSRDRAVVARRNRAQFDHTKPTDFGRRAGTLVSDEADQWHSIGPPLRAVSNKTSNQVCDSVRLVPATTQGDLDALLAIQAQEDIEPMVSEGNFSFDHGTVLAAGTATVEVCGDAMLTALDDVTVTALGRARVWAGGNAHVDASETAFVDATDSATVEACEWAVIEADGHAVVIAWGETRVRARGTAVVCGGGDAIITASHDCQVDAEGTARVTVAGRAHAALRGSSTGRAIQNASVTGYDDARIRGDDDSQITLHDRAWGDVYNDATVIASDDSRVTANGSVSVEAFDQAVIKVNDPSVSVTLHDAARTERVPVATSLLSRVRRATGSALSL